MTGAVVLDIEGTVSPLSAVHDVLFPYARQRIADWIRQGRAGAVVEEVRAALGGPADLDTVIAALLRWHDENAKISPLKTLQGLIWQQGFLAGELHGQIYPDVPVALAGWQAGGVPCWIYSSGSVLAQRLWFAHTEHGDLRGYLRGFFDTVNGGPKREAESYRRISRAIGFAGPDILFLSDNPAELDAARESGWYAVGVRREQDGSPDVGDHPSVRDFSEIDSLSGCARWKMRGSTHSGQHGHIQDVKISSLRP